ncbi:hypothetical protein Tco_0335387 [Tanacetum coccineum]
MSSGRRRNGPRPSHTDDAEKVDVTELCISASNTMRGLNILNPLPEPTDRPMISTSADKKNYQEGKVECHGDNVESHPHNEKLWNKVTLTNMGNTFGEYNASDHITF